MRKKTWSEMMRVNTNYLLRAYKKYGKRFIIPSDIQNFELMKGIPPKKRMRRSY